MATRIIIVDDHGIIREGLKVLLEKYDDIEVIGQANDGRSAVELTRQLEPDIVIMDITMPNLNGIDATKQIIEQSRKIKVIALSIHSSRHFVADMLKAGASGYVLKESLFDELIEAIDTVTKGKIYLSPGITSTVVDDYVKYIKKGNTSRLSRLSTRERQVLQLLSEGKSTRKIALELHVSPKTIETNRRHIMEKLEIYTVAELTKLAVREGLTSIEP
ncbi:MAG: response regulator transcription factor [Sedimentisphaerales bacterium]|nr:response regulator transcription factor [Sedimentisphaerales bacterium]